MLLKTNFASVVTFLFIKKNTKKRAGKSLVVQYNYILDVK